jgi:hypothetical protein
MQVTPMTAAVYAAGVLLVVSLSSPAVAYDAILTCSMDEETGFTIEKGRTEHVRERYKPTEIVFAGLDSPTPTMKGNAGESRLTVVRREAATVWLMEQPPIGGVNVYTLFRDTKRVIGTKQYHAEMIDVVFALTWIGRCR